jgi:hypothetical protein
MLSCPQRKKEAPRHREPLHNRRRFQPDADNLHDGSQTCESQRELSRLT